MKNQQDQVEVLNISSLVEYQEKAVVSRTLVDKKTGTVTVFSFDEGQGLSEHTSAFDALVYVLDGEAKITIAGKTTTVQKEKMIMLPANKPHALHAQKRFKMLLILIR